MEQLIVMPIRPYQIIVGKLAPFFLIGIVDTILVLLFILCVVFQIENMPKIIQLFTYIIPLRYFFIIIRGVFLKGVGLRELWVESAVLLLFGVAILTPSILPFRTRIAK